MDKDKQQDLIDSLGWAEFRRCCTMGIILLFTVALINPPEKYWTPIFVIFATAKICSIINRFGVGAGLTVNEIFDKDKKDR